MFQLSIKGQLWSLQDPKIMGILNLTPDSFFDGGRYNSLKDQIYQVEKMLKDGADIIDIGAMSSRPFSKELAMEEELKRIKVLIPELIKQFPTAIFSIDTYRSHVAEYALDCGVSIINDITAGVHDDRILNLAKIYSAPYIAMHMRGMPENMQNNATYHNIIAEILYFFSQRLFVMKKRGLTDIILDVGFGFGKEIADNFALLKHLAIFHELNSPILAGISRKSMIYKTLGVSPHDSLNGTSALHFEALRNGAHILRVHDVMEAKEVIKLYQAYQKA